MEKNITRTGLLLLFALHTLAQSDITSRACNPATRPAVVTSGRAEILSPGYPGNYDDNEYCEWLLRPAGGNTRIILNVAEFSTESCCDHVYVYNSRGNLILNLAGNHFGEVYEFEDSEIRVLFDSDGSITYSGFKINYMALGSLPDYESACDPLTLPVFVNSSVTYLRPYGGGDREYCFWVYTNPGKEEYDSEGFYVGLNKFTNMESSQLAIYSGEGRNGPVLFEYQSSSDENTVLWVRESTISVEFSSIRDTNAYFNITIFPRDEACADGSAREIFLESGVSSLQSPGYPNSVPDYLSCNWVISTLPGQTITVYNAELDLDSDFYCEKDFLEIMDGTEATSTSFGRFCDTDTFYSLTSTGNSLQVILRSDESLLGKRGFNLFYVINDDGSGSEGSGGEYDVIPGIPERPHKKERPFKDEGTVVKETTKDVNNDYDVVNGDDFLNDYDSYLF